MRDNKKRGRPLKSDPRNSTYCVRLNRSEGKMLRELMGIYSMSAAETLRFCLRFTHNDECKIG